MSWYEVSRICHLAGADPAFREALRRNPDATLSVMDLTEQERTDLLAGAVGRLYQAGVHPLLLCRLAEHELFGLDRTEYARQIVAEAVRPSAEPG